MVQTVVLSTLINTAPWIFMDFCGVTHTLLRLSTYHLSKDESLLDQSLVFPKGSLLEGGQQQSDA